MFEFIIFSRLTIRSGKLESPEFQRLVTEEIAAMRALASETPFLYDPDCAAEMNLGGTVGSISSDDDAAAPAVALSTPMATRSRSRSAAATPASAARVRTPASPGFLRKPSSSSSDDDASKSSSSSGSDSDIDDHKHASMPVRCGMETLSACRHLPDELNVRHHIHSIYKTEVGKCDYVCDVCGGHGSGGLVYACEDPQCGSWCSHLRCVLPPPTRGQKGPDMRMLLPASTVTSMFTLPAQQKSSDSYGLRAALIMDGCNGQVRAAKDLLESIFFPKGIDIIKGSAQCSPSQNPLDCMRSFMQVKKSKPTWTWSTATGASTEMLAFIDSDFRKTLGDCSPTDVNSFILSLLHLEATLSSCFTIKIMQSGWAKAGLIGLELNQIMSHWIGWKMLSAEQVQGASAFV
jgi:hypothetical protein